MSLAGPFPEVEIPSTSVPTTSSATSTTLILTASPWSMRSWGDRPAIARAGALADRGIGVGDVVGLLSPNSSGFAVAFHGILRVGATSTTINPLFTVKDIAEQLTDSKAKMVVKVRALLPQAREAAAAVGLPDADLVVLDGEGRTPPETPTALS